MALRRLVIALCLALCGVEAAAQQIVTSAAPDGVAVTVYTSPYSSEEDELDLGWLEGYALITEQRRVTIPAGRAVIRFEGVAGGMLPESAMVRGLPFGVREKNLDADLLSPGSLYARSLGRPVLLRRENSQTGEITEERAIIRSGPDGAAILQTSRGFVAVDCGPETEDLVYTELPAGLSARPTLSIETNAPAAQEVTIALSYLAWGFDWQTNYVVTLGEDVGRPELTAWVTLASSDPTSFVDADTAVIGGRVNREEDEREPQGEVQELEFRCFFRPAPSPLVKGFEEGEDDGAYIIVTGSRIQRMIQDTPMTVTVTEESLGDLRLYRVPIPTTIASNSQKQVALFYRRRVDFTPIYRVEVENDYASEASLLLVTRNRRQEGLGQALPRGRVAVFEVQNGVPLLIGVGGLRDHTVGEDVEIFVNESDQVEVDSRIIERGDNWRRVELTAQNDNPWPVTIEALIDVDQDYRFDRPSVRLGRKNARPMWRVTVPANGTAKLQYRLRDNEVEDDAD